MICTDKEEGAKLRAKATTDLIDAVASYAMYAAKNAQFYAQDRVLDVTRKADARRYIAERAQLALTLLAREMIVYARPGEMETERVLDVTLLYDGRLPDEMIIAANREGMRGGLDTISGGIHT
jgi:hypothetical protein